MKTKVPYSRDTQQYYVFEQEFVRNMPMRVSVYILKTECPNPPHKGMEIEVTVDAVEPEPQPDREFLDAAATNGDIPW